MKSTIRIRNGLKAIKQCPSRKWSALLFIIFLTSSSNLWCQDWECASIPCKMVSKNGNIYILERPICLDSNVAIKIYGLSDNTKSINKYSLEYSFIDKPLMFLSISSGKFLVTYPRLQKNHDQFEIGYLILGDKGEIILHGSIEEKESIFCDQAIDIGNGNCALLTSRYINKNTEITHELRIISDNGLKKQIYRIPHNNGKMALMQGEGGQYSLATFSQNKLGNFKDSLQEESIYFGTKSSLSKESIKLRKGINRQLGFKSSEGGLIFGGTLKYNDSTFIVIESMDHNLKGQFLNKVYLAGRASIFLGLESINGDYIFGVEDDRSNQFILLFNHLGNPIGNPIPWGASSTIVGIYTNGSNGFYVVSSERNKSIGESNLWFSKLDYFGKEETKLKL